LSLSTTTRGSWLRPLGILLVAFEEVYKATVVSTIQLELVAPGCGDDGARASGIRTEQAIAAAPCKLAQLLKVTGGNARLVGNPDRSMLKRMYPQFLSDWLAIDAAVLPAWIVDAADWRVLVVGKGTIFVTTYW